MLPSLLPDVAPPIWVVPLLENVAEMYEQLNVLAGGNSLPVTVAPTDMILHARVRASCTRSSRALDLVKRGTSDLLEL